jgi:UDP-GlcNAc3NAcA epimerase
MIDGLESIVLKEKFDGILVYGNTNSTLAGAIVGSKLHIPIFHIESGLRSFNKKMPEEINRIVTDQCSTLLFTPTMTGKLNLQREGFNFNEKLHISFDNPAVYHSGDVMLDNSLFFAKFSIEKSEIIKELEVQQNNFILCTIHRDTNTDDPTKLNLFLKH